MPCTNLLGYLLSTECFQISRQYNHKNVSPPQQGILDVGLTEEDHVELVKTRTFQRKHATGTANIDLHTLQVSIERDRNLATL